MTNKLQKQFFDTFDIKERELEYPDNFTYYPEITDHILLKLICIMADFTTKEDYCYTIFANNIERLRVHILEDCIEYKENIKPQVQALFKEER